MLKPNTSDRLFRWLLLLEEYGVTFEYLSGKKNDFAVALSHIDFDRLKIQDAKKNHYNFSQYQKAAASVISSSQCILP
jgi:hypothetical protein